jgi:hypothetical protein
MILMRERRVALAEMVLVEDEIFVEVRRLPEHEPSDPGRSSKRWVS